MAGKPQKPASALQFKRGGRLERRGPALNPVTEEPRPVPACPRGLHEMARVYWREFWLSAAGAAVRYETHGAQIRHWIACVSERAHTEEAIAKTPIVKGSMDQDTMNPLLAYWKELNRKVEKYEETFGAQPLAAMRLNIAEVQRDMSVLDLNRRLAEQTPRREPANVIDLDALA